MQKSFNLKREKKQWDYPQPFAVGLIHTVQYCRQESINLLYDTDYSNT